MALKKPIVLDNGILSQAGVDVIHLPAGALVGSGVEDPSALANFTSQEKGILVPRMSTAQRDAIATPGLSLLIFNTTTNKFNYHDSTKWQELGPLGIIDGGTY